MDVLLSCLFFIAICACNSSSTPLPNELCSKGSSVFECVCDGYNDSYAYNDLVFCDKRNEQVLMYDFVCVSFDLNKQEFIAGICLYSDLLITDDKSVLVTHKYRLSGNITTLERFDSDVMCKHINRTGRLCSQCNNESGLAINSYSFHCRPSSECHWTNWLVILLANFAPVTVLFIVVIVFHLNFMSGSSHLFIIFSQVMSLQINVVTFQKYWIDILHTNKELGSSIGLLYSSFYTIWSLQLGRCFTDRICVGENYQFMFSAVFQCITAIYSLCLIVLLYTMMELHGRNVRFVVRLWRPFRMCFSRFQRHLDAKSSIINAFATFFVLSYSQIVEMSIILLTPTSKYNSEGQILGLVLLYDGSVEYFGKEHVKYAVFAIITLFVFSILPVVILLMHPLQCVQRCLTYYHLYRPGLVIFMDAFQGAYKNGTTADSHDFRGFSALFLIARLLLFLLYSKFMFTFYPLQQLYIQIVLVIFLVLMGICRPYRKESHNNCDTALLALTVLIPTLCSCYWTINATRKESSIPLLIIILIVLQVPNVTVFCYVAYHICEFLKVVKYLKYCCYKLSKKPIVAPNSRGMYSAIAEDTPILFADRLERPKYYTQHT